MIVSSTSSAFTPTAPIIREAPLCIDPARLTVAKRRWTDLGYGMFVHFGMNTFDGKGWGDGKSPASRFYPDKLDCRQWAEVASEAGMRYAVLTTKHHDGFCLWPSKHTEYSVKGAGCTTDVVGEFADAFSAAGMEVGLYYSLWDCNFQDYDDDAAYAQYLQAQIAELLTQYGPIVELWFDGGWDKDHPTRDWKFDPSWIRTTDASMLLGDRWRWKSLYRRIHELQPDCLVINNSSSDRPGQVRYHPVDVRTAEHFDFIHGEKIRHPNTDANLTDDAGQPIFLPLEYCTSLCPDWFWIKDKSYSHPSAATIADWLLRARSTSANLLLNVGPDSTGRIPEYHRPFLRNARTILRGAAIPCITA